MANSPLLLLPILSLSIFCAFLFEISIGGGSPPMPSQPSQLTTAEALDRMDGISALSSAWTSPTISGSSTPEMRAGTVNLRRCASIATDRVPTTSHGAGRGRPSPTLSQQIRMPLSSPPRRTSNYHRSFINSPRKVPLADYQPVTALCLPRRMDRLFRSRSSTDERRRNSSSRKYGTNPPNFFSPSGVGTTSREANAQLSRESSGSKKKQQQQNVEEEKDKEKEKEKERDGTPNILKNLMPKSKSHKKREEKEEEKGQEKPKKEQTQPKGGKNLMRLWKLAKNKALGEKKPQKNGSSEDVSLRQKLNESSAEGLSPRQTSSSPAFSDTLSFQGFPSPDLKFHDSPNWPGFTKSGETSNSAKAKSEESAENSSAISQNGGEEKRQMIEN